MAKCKIHPGVKRARKGKCYECEKQKIHLRRIRKGKIQTTYTKSKEILTPMGNNSK